MNHDNVLSVLKSLDAGNEAVIWAETRHLSGRALWDKCPRGSWLLRIASQIGVDGRLVVLAACACARESLKYVNPAESRPQLAIDAAERWTRGSATIEEVRDASLAAFRAAAAGATYAEAYAATAAAYVSMLDSVYAAASYSAIAAAYAHRVDRRKYFKRSAELVRNTIPYSVVARSVEGVLR